MFCPRVEEKELQAIAKDIMAVHDDITAAAGGSTQQNSRSKNTATTSCSKDDKPVTKSSY